MLDHMEVLALAELTEGLVVHEHDGIATVTIDRPRRRNALSRALLRELAEHLGTYDESPLRAVVLEGGGGCFSAGADLQELDGSLSDLTMDDAVAGAAQALRRLSLPVVAAIEGPCMGAAVELAMACDLRVASSTAFFEVPAVRLGILYRPGAVADLSRRMPPAVLARLLLFGDRVSAGEAAELGLVTGPVVQPLEARARAWELARLLPAGPWPAARTTKRLLVELADGATDLAAFEAARRELAVSEERASALSKALGRASGAS